MSLFQIAGGALLGAMLLALLHELRSPLALPTRAVFSALLLGSALLLYAPVLVQIERLLAQTGAVEYAKPLLRGVGIALVCELTALFCRDLGEGTLALGVEAFGKLEILLLCLPLIDKILELAKELLQI